MNGPTALWIIGGLVVLLAVVTREWLVLRESVRRRGLFRRWPIPKVPVERLGPRFEPDALGATLAAEVSYVGRGSIVVPGGTSDTEAWILAVVARDARTMFEFGTCTGKTAYLWAKNQPAGGRVTTLTLPLDQIDQYRAEAGDDPGAIDDARQTGVVARFLYTGTEAGGRIEQLYGDSKAFDDAPYRESCDVIFVDGSHARSYVASDTEKALRMIKPGGLILWHDYNPDCAGVFKVLNELARRLPLMHVAGTALVAYRRPDPAQPNTAPRG